MSKLFESSSIGGMKLSNRFIRSATWEGMATEEGAVTPKLIETMITLIKGGVSLIISSHAYIRPDGKATPWQLGIYKDDLIPGFKAMTESIHDCGGKIVIQLAHAGRFAIEKLTGRLSRVVSDFEGLAKSSREELTRKDIRDIIAAFASAARRAKLANFDGIQLHSAHGYLLSQFLSPIFNKRQDEYGGEVRNRIRVHLEIYQAIRNEVGEKYPILIKMNCRDFAANGLSLEDSVQAAKFLTNGGFDAIEISGGLLTNTELSPTRLGINTTEKEAYFKEEAQIFKKEIKVPLILVGGIRSFDVAERLVEQGTADYISMSRPLIREPNLINRWKAKDRRKAECRSDNRCFRPGIKGDGIYCVIKRREMASI